MNLLRKPFSLLAVIAMLAGSVVVASTASAAPTTTTLPTHIVNGNFDYHPAWSTITTRTARRYTNIDPANGYYIKNAGESNVSWAKWDGFDASLFGWQSDQVGSGTQGGIQDRAKAVELQYDDKVDNTFAELVASETGKTIYQDIATVPLATYKVKLKHASTSSGAVDQMQVVIGGTPVKMTRTTTNGNGDPIGESSTTIATKVSNTNDYEHNGQWETYEGTYVVPANQTTTRFGFKALSATSVFEEANGSRGNVIDDVSFNIIYNVTYNKNANDATGTTSNQTCVEGDKLTLTANGYMRTGYTFAGWNTNTDGTGTKYTNKQQISPTSHLTLYAQWTPTKYTVRYNANPQKYMLGKGLMDDQQFTFDQTQKLTANTFTATGWTFTGWNTKANGTGNPYTNMQLVQNLTNVNNGVVDLYAQWKANPTSIKFNANGGKGTTVDTTGLVGEDCKFTANAYKRDGYTFTGWNASANGKDVAYADEATVVCPVNVKTVYAQWTANASKLSYNANNGSGVMADTEGVTDQKITVSENMFTRDGYEFTEWNTEPDGTGDIITEGSEFALTAQPSVIYAQWKALPSVITYLANHDNATGSTPTTEGMTDATVLISKNGFKVSGWTFTGWNTREDGTGAIYSPGTEFTLKPIVTALYAQWAPNPATVTYDANGGSGETPAYNGHASDTPNTSANQFASPSECITFTGWNTEPDGTGAAYDEGDKLPALLGDLTLYAQWDDTTCPATVTYDANGGSGKTDGYNGYLHDTPSTAKNRFTGKDCDTFVGWSTTPDDTGTIYQENIPLPALTGNITLYAQWEHKACAVTPLAKTGMALNSIALISAALIVVAVGLLVFSHYSQQLKRH